MPSIVNGTGGTASSYAFQLNAIPGISDFTTIFDFYKILMVKLQFKPRQTEQNNQIYLGDFHYVVDYNDAELPSSPQEIMSRQGSRHRYMVGRPFSVVIKPRVSQMLYESAGTTGYRPIYAPWVNTQDSTVPHYGLKTFYTEPSVGTTIDVFATYYLRFKGIGNQT